MDTRIRIHTKTSAWIRNAGLKDLCRTSALNIRSWVFRLFDLSSGQHLLDLGSELKAGAGQLDLVWQDAATFLACGYDTCTRLWDTRCRTYVRTWEEPYDESGQSGKVK
jgi:hypothetical protein